MPVLVDKSGNRTVVAGEDLDKALATGRFAVEGSVQHSVGDSSVNLSPEAIAQLQAAGNTQYNPAAAQGVVNAAEEATLERTYGEGLGNTALATLAGGARGASLGLSDLALSGILDDDQMFAMHQLQQRNEVASIAGEVGGMLLPALLSGGESLLGSAARLTPTALATRAGAGLAGRVAGEGVARSAMRGAVQAATEGALYGAGSTISQAALNDDPFTLDALASNMTLGAVLGGVTGAAIGGAGAAARKVLSASTPVDNLAVSLETADSKVGDLLAADAERLSQHRSLVDDYKLGLDAKDAYATERKLAFQQHQEQQLADKAAFGEELANYGNDLKTARTNYKAERKAAESLNKEIDQAFDKHAQLDKQLKQLEAKHADRIAKAESDLKKAALDYDRVAQKSPSGKRSSSVDSLDQYHNRVQKAEVALNDAEDRLAQLRRDSGITQLKQEMQRVESTALQERVPIPEFVEPPPPTWRPEPFSFKGEPTVPGAPGRFDSSLADKLNSTRVSLRAYLGDKLDLAGIFSIERKAVPRVAALLDDYVKTAKALDDSLGQRFGIGLDLGEEAVTAKLAEQGFDQAYLNITDEKLAQALGMEKALDKVKAMDPLAKNTLKAWAIAQSQAPEAVAARAGWFKKVSKGLAVGMGRNAIPGGARGSGFLATVARGGLRQVGGALAGGAAGYALDGGRGAAEGAMLGAGAVSTSVGGLAAKAIAALAKPGTARAFTAASVLGATRFGQEKDQNVARARMKEVAAAVTSPTTQRSIQVATLPVSLQNAAVGEKLQNSLMARLQYLYNASPYRPPIKGLRLTKAEVLPSNYETAKWARIVRAAENPMTLLEDLGNRQLAPEAVRTVKDLYPELFSRMQVTVMEKVGEHKEGLPYQSRLQLSTFFDVPLDVSSTPEFGATIASLYAPAQSTAQPQGSLGGSSKPATTQTQRLTSPT